MEHAGTQFGQGYLTADVATSILRQFVLSTMLANEAGVFQNDPNFGNLLVKETKEDQLVFKMNRQKMKVKSHGVLLTIIYFSQATNVLDPTSPPHEDVASLAQDLKELATSVADRDMVQTFGACATATSMQDIYPNSDLFKD
ncbi:Protein kinase domain-containing protein [Caenorhabditis elegans]|uniref:Protein kinase domain-containing protein n=1 Tax=Caenorhabditis elegans TaxID=6239 RepID=A0A0K3AVZ0_CAEEL|nr:Protein kinase domain-containing protein [Caenorhabditis elegans]CTQ86922.1 Protein kinase domain-containing protein [Caenorhabditis elegans]|eukprot:NP_001300223.1 Uncharacterized protein CELE_Y32G9A.3 [Caenorhabditis elegans]